MPHANLSQVSLRNVPVGQECPLVKWGALEQTISGPVVVVLNDSRLALGTEIAKELKVVLGENNAS